MSQKSLINRKRFLCFVKIAKAGTNDQGSIPQNSLYFAPTGKWEENFHIKTSSLPTISVKFWH